MSTVASVPANAGSTRLLDAGPASGTADTQFDTTILKARGLDPAIASLFRNAPRFVPGNDVVEVTLNGMALGRKNVTFGAGGQLCFTPQFIHAIGLMPIPPVSDAPARPSSEADAAMKPGTAAPSVACPDYTAFSPRTVVTLKPSDGAVDIVTPSEFVGTTSAVRTEYGGGAALFNYRVSDLESWQQGARVSFRELDSTLGLNVDDWIFRANQLFLTTNATSEFELQDVYAQKTFVDQRKILQFGRSWTQNAIFSGIPFYGAQWFTERLLGSSDGVTVRGAANSRARVEVRQNGVLLYTTVVPPGPFTLTGVSLLNITADLHVRVIEDNGAQEETIIPAAQLLLEAGNRAPGGFSIAAGRLWNDGQGSTRPRPFISVSDGWRAINGRLSGTVGGLVSNAYQASGISLSTNFGTSAATLYTEGVVSRDTAHQVQGATADLAMSFNAFRLLNVGLSGIVSSSGYRTFQQAQNIYPLTGSTVLAHTQMGANVSWNTERFGSLSAGVSRLTYFHAGPGIVYNLGWSIALGKILLGVNLAYSSSRAERTGDIPDGPGDEGNFTRSQTTQPAVTSSNYVYAYVTIPLGKQISSRTVVQQTRSTDSRNAFISTDVSQRINDSFGYDLAVEKDPSAPGITDAALTAYATPRYSSLSVGVDGGSGTRGFSAEASGGIVIERRGIAFSPYPIQDTLGVVKVGDVAGIRLETPSGPVWSGYGGLAAIPLLSAFHDSRVEVSEKSLPPDVDVDNALQVVNAGHGAVLDLSMHAEKVRRVLLDVKMADGTSLPAGLAVLRDTGELVTESLTGGRVMIDNLQDGEILSVQLNGGTSCLLKNIRLDTAAVGKFFQRGSASCDKG